MKTCFFNNQLYFKTSTWEHLKKFSSKKKELRSFFENILFYLIYLSNEPQDVYKKIMYVTEIFKIILTKYILIRIIVITIVNHRNSSFIFCFFRYTFTKNYLRYRIFYFTFHYISKHYIHYFISRVSTSVPER